VEVTTPQLADVVIVNVNYRSYDELPAVWHRSSRAARVGHVAVIDHESDLRAAA
jgi:hypothetical protein